MAAAGESPTWMTDGPHVDEEAIAFEVPVEVLANQLLVDVEVGGTQRRFLFDTGSPSMMNAALAAELGLEAVDRTRGRDSHGAVVETDIVQADLTLGGTTFRKTPVFVADFPRIARCLFDGVLGSEVLPLCAWQIDLPESVLRCHSDVNVLDHTGNAARLPLYDFGYPHAPFLDVHLAKNARSKAMLDTGSPEYLAISPPDLDGSRRNGGVGRTVAGTGSIGGSIGGRAPDRAQLMVEMKALALGAGKHTLALGRIGALLRESPPTLIGASILQHFVVTLDAKRSTAYFDRYGAGLLARRTYGFALDFDEAVRVSLVWDDSPAAEAGLRVGQEVASINGEKTDAGCDGIRRAMRAMAEAETLTLESEGNTVTLARKTSILD